MKYSHLVVLHDSDNVNFNNSFDTFEPTGRWKFIDSELYIEVSYDKVRKFIHKIFGEKWKYTNFMNEINFKEVYTDALIVGRVTEYGILTGDVMRMNNTHDTVKYVCQKPDGKHIWLEEFRAAEVFNCNG